MHWTHYLSTVKINEWRRVHRSKLLKTPVCTSTDFYREGDFVKPFSALICSSEWMLILLIAFCCFEYKPVESRAQIKAVRVQQNQKVLLIFVIYRKRRRITESLSQSRSAQKSHPAGKRYCHLTQWVWYQWFNISSGMEPRKQSMFKHCMFTCLKADSLLGIFMHLYIYLARKE